MPEIGIRELKANASAIVHNVQEQRAHYVVTLRGTPVAVIMPLDVPPAETRVPGLNAGDVWDELERLGDLLSKSWPPAINSADALSEMRR